MNTSKRIIILGKIPPPIGGVTIHVERLFSLANKVFPDYEILLVSKISQFYKIINADLIHVHFGNSQLRFILVLFAKICRTKVVCTFHRNFDRGNRLNRLFNILSAKYSDLFLTLNISTYKYFKQFSNNVELTTAFIQPIDKGNTLKNKDLEFLEFIKPKYKTVCCSASYSFHFFKGKEIYGFMEILEVAKSLNSYFFILSDPSGEYLSNFSLQNVRLPSNVYLISYPHDFNQIIKISDIVIRNTVTDGDSLTVKEALFHKKKVFATDVVNRPKGVLTYSLNNLEEALQNLDRVYDTETSVKEFPCKEFYSNFLS